MTFDRRTNLMPEQALTADEGNMPIWRRRSILRCIAAGVGAAHGLSFGQADSSWRPKRTVHLVVPFAAAGTTDIIARLVSAPLAEALGQAVIVENRAGANGNIGIAAVARAAPDGETLLFVSTAFITNPALYPGKPPYDPVRQFSPVTLAVTSPDIIVVKADSPITNLASFFAAAKRKAGGLTYATPGTSNSVHLGGEALWQQAGVKMLHVPYTGAGPAINAVLSGQTDCALTALPPATAMLAAGRLRAIAVGTLERWPSLPGVATVAESGFPGFRSETMQAVYGPTGMPAAAVERYALELRRILKTPAVRERTRELGFEVVASTPSELAKRIAEDAPRWVAVARHAGIRAE